METVLSILYYNTKCLGKQVLIRSLRRHSNVARFRVFSVKSEKCATSSLQRSDMSIEWKNVLHPRSSGAICL